MNTRAIIGAAALGLLAACGGAGGQTGVPTGGGVSVNSTGGQNESGGTGISQPTGGGGLSGWLSGIYKAVTGDATAPTTNSSAANQQVGQCISACNATTLLGPIDTTGFGSFSLHTTSIGGGGTITFQGSNDQTCSAATNWNTIEGMFVNPATFSGFASSSTGVGIVTFPKTTHCVRFQVTAYTSGTLQVELYLFTGSSPVIIPLGGQIGLNGIFPNSGSTSGIAAIASTAAEGSHILKASAGTLYSLGVTTGASAGNILIHNTTSAPGDGAVTPRECIVVPANTTTSINFNPGPTEYFSIGITVVFSTPAGAANCNTQTTSATAWFSGKIF